MLDRMIESKNDPAEKFRRANFLLTTLLLVTMMFSGAMLYSLYAKPLGMTGGDLELSSIVAPVAETEPPPAESPKRELKTSTNTKTPTETIRIVNQKTIDESPDIPKDVSTVNNQFKSRPPGAIKIGSFDGAIASSNSEVSRAGSPDGVGIGLNPKQNVINDEEKDPPKMPKPVPAQPPTPKIKSLGVINGIAQNLPLPVYPAAARAVRVWGAVNVQVTIDEQGRVISAKAVSGHPLLRQAAEQAAQRAVFSPTKLSNIPVKVTGVIVYNFVAQ